MWRVQCAWTSLWVSWNADLNRQQGMVIENRDHQSGMVIRAQKLRGVHIAWKQTRQLGADRIQEKVETM